MKEMLDSSTVSNLSQASNSSQKAPNNPKLIRFWKESRWIPTLWTKVTSPWEKIVYKDSDGDRLKQVEMNVSEKWCDGLSPEVYLVKWEEIAEV